MTRDRLVPLHLGVGEGLPTPAPVAAVTVPGAGTVCGRAHEASCPADFEARSLGFLRSPASPWHTERKLPKKVGGHNSGLGLITYRQVPDSL